MSVDSSWIVVGAEVGIISSHNGVRRSRMSVVEKVNRKTFRVASHVSLFELDCLREQSMGPWTPADEVVRPDDPRLEAIAAEARVASAQSAVDAAYRTWAGKKRGDRAALQALVAKAHELDTLLANPAEAKTNWLEA